MSLHRLRRERIASMLNRAEELGVLHDWYAYSPDGNGTRWVLDWAGGVSTRVLSTREADAVSDALIAVLDHFDREVTTR